MRPIALRRYIPVEARGIEPTAATIVDIGSYIAARVLYGDQYPLIYPHRTDTGSPSTPSELSETVVTQRAKHAQVH